MVVVTLNKLPQTASSEMRENQTFSHQSNRILGINMVYSFGENSFVVGSYFSANLDIEMSLTQHVFIS